MKKLLRPKDVLLLGLAQTLDIFEEVKHPLGISALGAQAIYGWVPGKYKKHNFRRVIERGLRTAEIERIVKNNEVLIRLTSAGREKISRDFPFVSFQENKWDKKWRVVIFDIAEVSRGTRDNLRLKLKELGFGMLQESVWISPYDILKDFREFLEAKGLDKSVYVFEVSVILAGNIDILIDRIWHISDLNQKYKDLIIDVRHNDRYKKHTIEFRQRYIEILMTDPCLPKDILPNDWAGDEARKVICEL